ncbi:MAG: hypothetical protein JZU63_14350 [Rhodoferax sp.]|nr:hypothetical protein [Rhodoferax sp.]
MSEERLARIENKVDNLAEAMVLMARIEERMVTIFKRMDRQDEAQASMETKLSVLEKHSVKRGVVETAIDKLLWLVIGGAVMWYFRK